MTKELRLMTWPVRLPSSYFTGFLMINHPPVEGACEYGWGKEAEDVSVETLLGWCEYFEERTKNETLDTGSMEWDAIIPTHSHFIELLKNKDIKAIQDYLKNMWATPLCHGTAQGKYFYDRLIKNEDDIIKNTGFAIYDKFLTLMEANAIIPSFSPEEYSMKSDFLKFYTIDPDDYLDLLEKSFNCDLSAPSYQGKHFGIQTKRHGLYSDRDIMALGIAIRIRETYWKNQNISICDIGGGVGYLTYWLNKLGFKNITYIDLPSTTISAMYFLHINKIENVTFLSPEHFDGNYDLVINFDGITTYGEKAAKKYMSLIEKNTKHFMSINREIDEYRVCDICNMRRISRNPFWLRKGYVEEDYVRNNS